MRALILSDLHIEHAPYVAPAGDYDLVILAGDIHNGVQALRWARQTFERHPIIQIAGNHEYYDHVLQPLRLEMREAANTLGIHYLDDSAVVIGEVEFLGCTLWTDFRVFEASNRAVQLSAEHAMKANQGLMADFFAIQFESPLPNDRVDRVDRRGQRSFEPADSQALHFSSRQWLTQRLSEPKQCTRVVISHHLPSWRSVSAAFATAVSNASFVSDLEPLVAQADWWIHGHTHSSHRYTVGAAQLICNPRGYPRRKQPGTFENAEFDPALVVDLRNSSAS